MRDGVRLSIKVRAFVAPLGDDRATLPDIQALQALIYGGAFDDLVCISPGD